jgi:hypothetical protein
MLANEKAKKAGLHSLNEMSEITGVSRHTLNNWNKATPLKFDIFLLGAVFKKFINNHKGDSWK